MPQGYFVHLGNGSLGTGDTIVEPFRSFETATPLGTGNWSYSGYNNGTFSGLTTASGSYFVATDGNVYFVPANGAIDSISNATAFNPPAYTAPAEVMGTPDADGSLSGTEGARLMRGRAGSVTLSNGTEATFSNIEDMICFTPGTMIMTESGPRAIETLAKGDLILTRDDGPQPLRWVGQRTVKAEGKFAPIEIMPSVMADATSPLLVSPQHRILFEGYRAELLFGESEVLVPAAHLLNGKDVTRVEGGHVTYIHLMFDDHQIIFANGAATESFHASDEAISAIADPAREELFAIFPELRADLTHYGRLARRSLRQHESALLIEN